MHLLSRFISSDPVTITLTKTNQEGLIDKNHNNPSILKKKQLTKIIQNPK